MLVSPYPYKEETNVRMLTTAVLLLAAASAAAQSAPAQPAPAQPATAQPATAETAYYRVELLPSGSLVSIGAPVAKGTMFLIHGYPDGKLISIRKSDIKRVSSITAQEATKPAQKAPVAIADLPMQGGSGPAGSSSAPGAASAGRAPAPRPATGPRIVPTSDGMAITIAPKPD
jgi:hypothetical protein